MQTAQIYQIFHSDETREALDAGFLSLDNTGNPNPDWREYAAVSAFFKRHSVNEDELYGFLSADFANETALNAQRVFDFIEANPGYDVYTFAPSVPERAGCLNSFEHADRLHPGVIEAAEAYLQDIGLEVDLRTLAMDARSMVSGYYVVAKPSFWKIWFPLTEKLFELSEGAGTALRERLDASALGVGQLGIKALLVERIASLVLALCPDIRVCACDPALPSSGLAGTPLVASSQLLYACFTHVPPPFQFPSYVSMLCLGDEQGIGKANLRDLAPEWEPHHPQLGSLAGCFALKNYIVKNRLRVRQVGMCQYRKFVSATRISGVPADNYPVMDVVNRHTLDNGLLHELMLPGDRDFLLGRPWVMQLPIYQQYALAHLAQDLLRFSSEAVELGVLPGVDVLPFYANNALMPGGVELGVFPTEFWIDTISSIEKVVHACLVRYPEKRVGYQVRNWAFCAERLGSHLLLKHLTATYGPSHWQQHFIGQLNLLTDGEKKSYEAGQ